MGAGGQAGAVKSPLPDVLQCKSFVAMEEGDEVQKFFKSGPERRTAFRFATGRRDGGKSVSSFWFQSFEWVEAEKRLVHPRLETRNSKLNSALQFPRAW